MAGCQYSHVDRVPGWESAASQPALVIGDRVSSLIVSGVGALAGARIVTNIQICRCRSEKLPLKKNCFMLSLTNVVYFEIVFERQFSICIVLPSIILKRILCV